MTAIITYFNKSDNKAIISCDNVGKTDSGYEITDKCYCLFSRFYAAVYGPQLLIDAIFIAKDYEEFDNIVKPKNVDELISVLTCLYKTRIEYYFKHAKNEYCDPDKIQEIIIYDSKVHQMLKVSFGNPFDREHPFVRPCKEILSEGINYFSLFNRFNKPDIETSKFIDNPKAISNKLFNELNSKIENSSTSKFESFPDKVGTVGSFFERNKESFTYESAFTTYREICEQFERSNEKL
ncbi:MAG TPA: hypothetical protein PK624_13255 [Spirochaetota bacterium]|nr:hypothetical protein [Spirochaetota bacterium]HOR45754.1 hypothetical protein [Spirochaetota bacterium]HPK57343.1 hypothetical protein [Spirochaetota bacterium]